MFTLHIDPRLDSNISRIFWVLVVPPISLFDDALSTTHCAVALCNPSRNNSSIVCYAYTELGIGALSDDESSSEHVPAIHVSPLFAHLHGLKEGAQLTMDRLSIPLLALSTVTLMPLLPGMVVTAGVPTESLRESIQSDRNIVRQGGLLLLPSHHPLTSPRASENSSTSSSTSSATNAEAECVPYYVLECGALLQGVVTKDTLLVLAGDEQCRQRSLQVHSLFRAWLAKTKSWAKFGASPEANELSESLVSSRVNTPISSPLRASNLGMSRILGSPSDNPLIVSSFLMTGAPRESVLYCIDVLPSPLKALLPLPKHRMPDVEIGVTYKTLRALGCMSGAWVMIASAAHSAPSSSNPSPSFGAKNGLFASSSSSGAGNTSAFTPKSTALPSFGASKNGFTSHANDAASHAHMARVYLINPPLSAIKEDPATIYEDNVIYLSPSLLFNLGFEEVPYVPAVTIKPMDDLQEKLIAKDVFVSLVRTPSMPTLSAVKRALVTHFATPKLVRAGDVFGASVKIRKYQIGQLDDVSDSDDDSEDCGEDVVEECLYFQVRSLTSSLSANADSASAQSHASHDFSSNNHHLGSDHSSVEHHQLENVFGFVDAKKSRLTQDERVSSKVPKRLKEFTARRQGQAGGVPDVIATGYPSLFQVLKTKLKPSLHPLSAQLGLSSLLLLHGVTGVGKGALLSAVARAFGIHCMQVNCYDLVGAVPPETEKHLKKLFAGLGSTILSATEQHAANARQGSSLAPCLVVLKNIHALQRAQNNEIGEDTTLSQLLKSQFQEFLKSNSHIIFAATTSQAIDELSKTIRGCFRDELKMEVPDLAQRKSLLSLLVQHKQLHPDISVADMALHTASYTTRDLAALIALATRFSLERAEAGMRDGERTRRKDSLAHGCVTSLSPRSTMALVGVALCKADLEQAAKSFSKHAVLGAPKIPNVKWEDIGGLISVKREILDTVQFPLEHPELFSPGLKQRSGVLLYGPPGTGKTLLAKAVATECSLNFISVKGPELINMYVGESEKNVREVFARARAAKPCVIFFDELDSLAPNRGRSGDSGGVMDRVVSQLLAELSAINQSGDIFIIGATNRPDLIDPALMVPGRLDKLLYLGVAEDKDSQENILHALTRKFHLKPNTNMKEIAALCPNNLTGADFYALAADAFAIALNEMVTTIEATGPDEIRRYQSGEKVVRVAVGTAHFEQAIRALTPSVSTSELERYKSLQSKYQKQKK